MPKRRPAAPPPHVAGVPESTGKPTTAAEATPTPAEPLSHIQLEDWQPLATSLAYRIGRLAWVPRAAELLNSHTVPHLVHDNGAVSQRTARLLYAWCEEREAAGALPSEIVVCEAGMGTGLHLRYMLDAFALRCRETGRDWYERLVVLATDVSAAVARQAVARGLFDGHAGHVRLGYLDVENPRHFVELDTGIELDLGGRVHVFIAFYLLDLLAVDVFRRVRLGETTQWEAVWVRTWLRDPHLLSTYTDATAEELVALAAMPQPAPVQPLLDAWTLVQQELRAWPVDLSSHRDLAELDRVADSQEAALGADHPLLADGTVVVHSAGALRSVQLLGATLAHDGMLLVRDVALTTAEQAAHPRAHARYGQVAAAAVHMRQLDSWFARGMAPLGLRSVAPLSDGNRGQATRLVVRQALPATEAVFEQAFDGTALESAARRLDEALASESPATSLELLRQAIADEPTDWTLQWEAARVALERLGRADVARAIVEHALALNPTYSVELWCLLGDVLHAQGDRPGALRALQQAVALDGRHAQALWGLAWLQAERGRFGEAFELLGRALRWDREGRWRGQVLQLLDVCLRGQALQADAEARRLAERDAG